MSCVIALLSCFACLQVPPGSGTITAEHWLNHLTIRPADSRTYFVLFFDMDHEKGLREEVARLNELSRRRDVAVVAVTHGREKEGRAFVARYRPRFPVGVQSPSYRSFRITQFPTVVLLKGETRKTVENWLVVPDILGPAPEAGDLAPEELSVEELQARIENDEDLNLLDMLRLRTEPDEFLRYCDQLERKLGPDAWQGPLQYQRHLADPNDPIKQPATTPALDAVRQAIQNGTSKRSELRALLASKQTWTTQDILDVYAAHAGDAPEDLVYRADWGRTLGPDGKPEHVEALLQMLEVEPDPAIRREFYGAIGSIHTSSPLPNREDVLLRLELSLKREENIRWARPSLDLTIALLKKYPQGPDQP